MSTKLPPNLPDCFIRKIEFDKALKNLTKKPVVSLKAYADGKVVQDRIRLECHHYQGRKSGNAV